MNDGWIYLSDKMPEQGADVLVSRFWTNKRQYIKEVARATWFLESGSAHWYFDTGEAMMVEPYAWQPVPEPADLKGVTVVHVKE